MADPTTAPVWAQLGYLVAAVCFILALRGLATPRTSRIGNLVGAAGAVLAVAVTFAAVRPDHLLPILVALALGAAVGAVAARRVVMTAMPQLVALFNGVGGCVGRPGGAARTRRTRDGGCGRPDRGGGSRCWSAAVSFAGSLVTFGKLQDWVPGRPIVVTPHLVVYGGVLVVTLAAGG